MSDELLNSSVPLTAIHVTTFCEGISYYASEVLRGLLKNFSNFFRKLENFKRIYLLKFFYFLFWPIKKS